MIATHTPPFPPLPSFAQRGLDSCYAIAGQNVSANRRYTVFSTVLHRLTLCRPLRSLKPVGVIQELYALVIAHYAIRFLMHEAACFCQAKIGPFDYRK